MRELWRRRGFRDLLIGQGVSALGDWMGTVAFMALVLHVTGSSTAVGGILVLRLAPAAIAGPLAARLSGRLDRRSTMLAMDAARAVMIALVPLVSALWWIYLWAFLNELASIAFLPARDASIPDLVEEHQLETADAVILGSSYGFIPIGAGAFGLVTWLTSGLDLGERLQLGPVFWIDSLTFVVSYLMIRRIHLPSTEATKRGQGKEEGRFMDALRIPLVRSVLPATIGAVTGIGVLFSLGVVFVQDVLSASNTQFGVLIALFGVGAFTGLVLLRWRDTSSIQAVRFTVAVQGITIAVMSLSPTVEIAYIGAVFFGGAAAAALAAGMSVLQRRLDGDQRVLAFTVFHVVIRGGLSVAAIGAGVAADLIKGVSWPLVGKLEPARLVLLFAGVLVFFSAASIRGIPTPPPARSAASERAGPGAGPPPPDAGSAPVPDGGPTGTGGARPAGIGGDGHPVARPPDAPRQSDPPRQPDPPPRAGPAPPAGAR